MISSCSTGFLFYTFLQNHVIDRLPHAFLSTHLLHSPIISVEKDFIGALSLLGRKKFDFTRDFRYLFFLILNLFWTFLWHASSYSHFMVQKRFHSIHFHNFHLSQTQINLIWTFCSHEVIIFVLCLRLSQSMHWASFVYEWNSLYPVLFKFWQVLFILS